MRHAYLAMRGGDKRKIVTRGVEPGHFVGIVIGHADGSHTAYELQMNGRQNAVILTVKRPGKEIEYLLTDELAD